EARSPAGRAPPDSTLARPLPCIASRHRGRVRVRFAILPEPAPIANTPSQTVGSGSGGYRRRQDRSGLPPLIRFARVVWPYFYSGRRGQNGTAACSPARLLPSRYAGLPGDT